jgi:hypothetical protein
MAGFFEQNFRFLLFYQNFSKMIFFKNSKMTWLRKVLTNKDVDFQAPGGRESLWTTGESNFHVSTMKSRKYQVWIFLIEDYYYSTIRSFFP